MIPEDHYYTREDYWRGAAERFELQLDQCRAQRDELQVKLEKTHKCCDPWHPFSEAPKSEDFEPLGWIHAMDDDGNHHRLTKGELVEWSQYHDYTFWRKITPP